MQNLQVGRPLGSGRFGRVYHSRVATRRLRLPCELEVAAKVINKEAVKRAGAEALLAAETALHAQLKHPNILELLEVIEEDTRVIMLLELAPGGSLERRLAQAGPARALPEEQAQSIVRGLAAALAHCHAAGIIHRDVKPDNALFASDGRVLLSDFGMAAALGRKEGGEGPASLAHGVMGTTEFLAPEMLACGDGGGGGGYSGSVDVWALGVLAHEALLGYTPHARYEAVPEEGEEEQEQEQRGDAEAQGEGGEGSDECRPSRERRGGVAWCVAWGDGSSSSSAGGSASVPPKPQRVRYMLNAAATVAAIMGSGAEGHQQQQQQQQQQFVSGAQLAALRCAAAGVACPQVSPAAQAFLQAVLVPDPAARPTAADLLRHPWLAPPPPSPSPPVPASPPQPALHASPQATPKATPAALASPAAATPAPVVAPPPTPGTKRSHASAWADSSNYQPLVAPTPGKRARLAAATQHGQLHGRASPYPGWRTENSPPPSASRALHSPRGLGASAACVASPLPLAVDTPSTAAAASAVAAVSLTSPVPSSRSALRVRVSSPANAAACGSGLLSPPRPMGLTSPGLRLGSALRVPIVHSPAPKATVPWKL